jgi:hypothetical protein
VLPQLAGASSVDVAESEGKSDGSRRRLSVWPRDLHPSPAYASCGINNSLAAALNEDQSHCNQRQSRHRRRGRSSRSSTSRDQIVDSWQTTVRRA